MTTIYSCGDGWLESVSDEEKEQIVRQLRNCCFGQEISNKGWDSVKKNWMTEENIAWLVAHQPKRRTTPYS